MGAATETLVCSCAPVPTRPQAKEELKRGFKLLAKSLHVATGDEEKKKSIWRHCPCACCKEKDVKEPEVSHHIKMVQMIETFSKRLTMIRMKLKHFGVFRKACRFRVRSVRRDPALGDSITAMAIICAVFKGGIFGSVGEEEDDFTAEDVRDWTRNVDDLQLGVWTGAKEKAPPVNKLSNMANALDDITGGIVGNTKDMVGQIFHKDKDLNPANANRKKGSIFSDSLDFVNSMTGDMIPVDQILKLTDAGTNLAMMTPGMKQSMGALNKAGNMATGHHEDKKSEV